MLGSYTISQHRGSGYCRSVGHLNPFDPGSPYWIAGSALTLARRLAVPVEEVINVFDPLKKGLSLVKERKAPYAVPLAGSNEDL